jgi:hypothetical protein
MNKNFLLKINVLFVSEVMSTVFAHFISWTRQTFSLLKFSWLNIFLTISDNTCVFKDPFVYTLEFICLGVFESTVHFKLSRVQMKSWAEYLGVGKIKPSRTV